jgi:hypothetical protein
LSRSNIPKATPRPDERVELTAARVEKALLAAEILVAYVPARWHLHRRPFTDLLAWARDSGDRGHARVAVREEAAEAARLGRAVARTLARLPTDSRCLISSLVLTRLLTRRRIEARLVIAVFPGPDFAAHAWVEHLGRPLLRRADPRYERLVEL